MEPVIESQLSQPTVVTSRSLIQKQICPIPGCGRTILNTKPPIRSSVCRYHVQRKARHGSHWHPTYSASEIRPYTAAAEQWIAANLTHAAVLEAIRRLENALWAAGPAEPAMNLRGLSAATRARVAMARIREREILPKRLLATYIAVCALIEDDYGSHRVREFRIVQAAKAVHRLASGTHKRWEMWRPNGDPVPFEIHAYPRSSGIVLRKLGQILEAACDDVARIAVPSVIALRTQRLGEHPSHLPGWHPVWQRPVPPGVRKAGYPHV